MPKTIKIALTAVATAALLASPALAAGKNKRVAKPDASFKGQWYTSPQGCSYSRSQAPGHPPMWVLIQNPHHIGKPDAKFSCPSLL